MPAPAGLRLSGNRYSLIFSGRINIHEDNRFIDFLEVQRTMK
jgi:hypothetical protein